MDDPIASESPLDAVAGTVDRRTVDAFELLSDETRLAILLALWEAHDPVTGDNAVSFSTLYDRVSPSDSGTFAYHLDKLVGHFVDETDEGYRLRHSGLKIVQTVVAGSGLEEPTLSTTDIDASCRRCGAPVELSYEDEFLYLKCTACEGNFSAEFRDGVATKIPRGTLVAWDLDPAALADRTPGQVYAAGHISSHVNVKSFVRGVCPECSGAVDESVQICEDHETDREGNCPACGTDVAVRVRYVCTRCKLHGSYPVIAVVSERPVVNAFYFEQGIDYLEDVEDPESCARVIRLRRESEQTLVSADPVRIRVTVPGNDATLQLTLDEDLDVLDAVERRQNPA